jgi:hypothetical protein
MHSLAQSIEATLARDEHALRKMGPARRRQSLAKLASYREQIAAREAQEAAQDAEQNASQAAPAEPAECDNCEGTGSVLLASGSIGCTECNATGYAPTAPAESPAERETRQAKAYDALTAKRQEELREDTERDQARAQERAQVQEIPTVRTPPPYHRITPAAAAAAPIRTEPDDELRNLCRSILQRWTLGTVLDQMWESEAKLFGTLTQPRQARAKRTA